MAIILIPKIPYALTSPVKPKNTNTHGPILPQHQRISLSCNNHDPCPQPRRTQQLAGRMWRMPCDPHSPTLCLWPKMVRPPHQTPENLYVDCTAPSASKPPPRRNQILIGRRISLQDKRQTLRSMSQCRKMT